MQQMKRLEACAWVCLGASLLTVVCYWLARQVVTPARDAQAEHKVVHVIRHGAAEHNVRYARAVGVVFKELIDNRSKTPADRDNRTLFPEIEEWAYMTNETLNSALVEAGVSEAQALGEAWARDAAFLYDRQGVTEFAMPVALHDVDLVVTSPLTRALQTTRLILFDGQLRSRSPPRGAAADAGSVPIVALDVVKEWSQGRHTPNWRRPRGELQREYSWADFGMLDGELDTTWQEWWPDAPDGLEPRASLESRVAQFRAWLAARPEQRIVVVAHSTFLGNLLWGTFIDDPVAMEHAQIYELEL